MDTTDIVTTHEVSMLGWILLFVILIIIIFGIVRKLRYDRRFKLTKLTVRSKISINNDTVNQASVDVGNQGYRNSFLKYSEVFNQHVDARKQTNTLLKKLESTTCYNFKLIEKSKSLCKQPYDEYELEQKLNSYNFIPDELYPLRRVSKYYMKPIVALILGLIVGAILVMAGLSLVSMLGNASTGTSLQSLSGAAETNATLSWFGGGSLASGGDGIDGGIITLIVIFLIPIVALFCLSINGRESKIRKFKQETKKLRYDDVQLRNSNQLIEAEIAHIKVLYKYIDDSYQEICKLIYPNGNITRVGRGLSSIINRDHYNEKEAKAIDRLAQAISYVDQTSDKMR